MSYRFLIVSFLMSLIVSAAEAGNPWDPRLSPDQNQEEIADEHSEQEDSEQSESEKR